MPMYKFECECGERHTEQMTFEEHDRRVWHEDGAVMLPCVVNKCDGTMYHVFKQVFDFHYNLGMREHYSSQLDMNVTSDQHFNNELKRQQDEYQARMGMDVNFETIDPGDMAAAGATDAGLEEQARANHDEQSDGHRSIFT